MKARIVSQVSEEKWLELMKKDSNATIFHHPAWLSVIASSYGYKLIIFEIQDKSGKIVGGLPMFQVSSIITGNRSISIPFSDYFMPLASTSQQMYYLIEFVEQYCIANNIVQLCIRDQLPKYPAIFENKEFVLHKLKLQSDPSQVFKTFSKKFRQYSRKAEKNGLHIVTTNQQQDIDIFYSLHLKNRKKLGVPVQPKYFFDLIWKRLISQGLGHIILVSNGTKIISGAVLLYFGEKIMIKYSASDPMYLHERSHYYTFWKSIEWACLNGFSVMDFGRTDITDDGLRKFKNGWGTEEIPLFYSYIGDEPQKYTSKITTDVMKLIIRHSPDFVTKGMGELLYKHFA